MANHKMLFCFAQTDYHHSVSIICTACSTISSDLLGPEVFMSAMIAVLHGVRKQAHCSIETSACSHELASCPSPKLLRQYEQRLNVVNLP